MTTRVEEKNKQPIYEGRERLNNSDNRVIISNKHLRSSFYFNTLYDARCWQTVLLDPTERSYLFWLRRFETSRIESICRPRRVSRASFRAEIESRLQTSVEGTEGFSSEGIRDELTAWFRYVIPQSTASPSSRYISSSFARRHVSTPNYSTK